MTVALDCPRRRSRVADLIGARGASATYAPGTVVGFEHAARSVVVEPRAGARASAQVTMLCKAPDPSGSIVARARAAAPRSRRAAEVSASRAPMLLAAPGRRGGRLGPPRPTGPCDRPRARRLAPDRHRHRRDRLGAREGGALTLDQGSTPGQGCRSGSRFGGG